MPKSVADLARTVVPLAAQALSAARSEAEAPARDAVRAAASWFLDGEPVERLRGHELNKYAVEQFMGAATDRLGLSVDDASAASSGVDMFLEGLQAVATREQYGWGWVRPRPLSQGEAESLLRAGVQHLVNAAAFVVTGSARASARAQGAVAGIELDVDALVAKLEDDIYRQPGGPYGQTE